MKHQGFTLIEIILVIAIAALIASLTTPYMSSYMASQELQASAEEIVGNLRRAQNKAIINEGNLSWGVNWHSTSYEIVNYPTSLPETIENYSLPQHITVSGHDVSFDKLTGKTNTNNLITIYQTAINEQKEISINEEGKIEIQ